MTRLAELPVLPVELPEFSIDPGPYLVRAQAVHPWLARFPLGYIVHGCQAVADLLADGENLQVGFGPVVDFYGLRGTMWGRFMTEIIMASSGPTHKRLRDVINPSFTPRRAVAAQAMVRQIISDLLDEWAPKGAFDFAEFASFIPVAVTCALLGVSADPIPRIRTALENQMLSVSLDPAAKPLFLAGWEVLWDFAGELVAGCDGHDPEALLDVMVAAWKAGTIDEVELKFLVLVMIIGGYDTTKNQLSMTMKLALERPEIFARCAGDAAYCGKVVDEALRHSATVSPFRSVKDDFSYGGVTFKKGETLVLATPLAGRDPGMFADPEIFDPERENARRHVGFGRGFHICPGQFIARLMMLETLNLCAQRLRHARIDGAVTSRPILGSWGPRELPIRFDPA